MAELHGEGRAVAPASDPGSDSRAFAAGGWQVGDLPHFVLCGERFDAAVQIALVARSRVFLDDAGLRRSVNDRKRGWQQGGGGRRVLAGDGAPHGADLVAEAGLILAVDFRAPFHLAHPLERGIRVGHLC